MKKTFFFACVIFILGLGFALCWILLAIISAMNLKNPSNTFDQRELHGIWTAKYGKNGIDKLTLYEDGLFEQNYNQYPNYQFESGKSTWSLKKFPDDRIELHLAKGRYYRAGASYYEQYGHTSPFVLYNPFARNSIIMDNELVLEVVYQGTGQLVLYNMFVGSDEGFPLLEVNGNRDYFTKIIGQ